MPAFLALVSTCAPEALSRFVMTRTLTPSWIIESAMVANLFLSPRAFWMSALTPAASNACCRYGLSNDSHRCDDCVSGRVTPTWARPPAGGGGGPPAGAAGAGATAAARAAAGGETEGPDGAHGDESNQTHAHASVLPATPRGRPDPRRTARICCEPQHIPGRRSVKARSGNV